MKRYLLDTNHLSEAVRRVSVVRDRIQQQSRKGTVFGTCGPVLCELLVGVLQCKDLKGTRRRLDNLLQRIRIWPLDLAIAEKYGNIYLELQKAGCVLSQTDMILASLCRHHQDLILLTTDQDFKPLADIETENWIRK